MSRRMEIVGNILAEILNYTLAAALQILIFLDFIQQWPGFLRIVLLLFIPVFYYLVRELCKSRILFFLLHLLPPLGVISLWGRTSYEKAVFAVIVIVFALISIGRRLTEKENGMEAAAPPGAAGFFFFLYLVDNWQSAGKSSSYIMLLMIWYVLGYFLFFYFRRFSGYIDVNNRTTEHIPVKRAFYSSLGLMTGFLGISAAVICVGIGKQLPYRMIAGIKRILIIVITFLFSLIPKGEAQSEIWSGGPEKPEAVSPVYEPAEPSVLTWILNVLVYILGIAAIIALLAVVVISFIRLVEKAFQRKCRVYRETGEEEDKVESLLRTERRKKKGDEGMGFFMWGTPSYAVRRQYLRVISRKYKERKHEKTEKQPAGKTARECCEALFPEKEKEAGNFAELYEKARYSDALCDKEDVKQMKYLAGELLK